MNVLFAVRQKYRSRRWQSKRKTRRWQSKRKRMLELLLPGLNALFGFEYVNYKKEHKALFEAEMRRGKHD